VKAGGRSWSIAAAALLAGFVASRALLVGLAYDRVANWEEPVFLFSGIDLGARGLGAIFDYQDDLSHGSSLPLVALASVWVRTVGTPLDLLKGIAIFWSTLTLLALLAVAARFASPRVALLCGLLYGGASAPAAMLQVTLVGSHPESLLFMTLALGAYLRTLEQDAGRRHSVLLGLACGSAVWCSYLAAPLALALGAAHVLPRPRRALPALAGLAVGFSPWIVQNLILRPHGAWQWTARAAALHTSNDLGWSVGSAIARSLADGSVAGAVIFALLVSSSTWAVIGCLRNMRAIHFAVAGAPAAVLPVAGALVLSVAVLQAAKPQPIPAEGFYYFRFFAPTQLLLFWLAAIGLEDLGLRYGAWIWRAGSGLAVLLCVLSARSLYGASNTYVADFPRDLERGCAVFGHAEVDRARSDRDAVRRLETIDDAGCRRAAFRGYGWGVVSRYARDGDATLLAQSFDLIPDPQLRHDACASARGLMTTFYEGAMSSDRRRTGAIFLDSSCASVSAVEAR